MRLGMARTGPIELAIELERFRRTLAVGEEPGEGIGQPEMRGHLRSIIGAAENPDLGRGWPFRVGVQLPEGVALRQGRARQEGHEIADIARELGGALIRERIERERRAPVRPWSAP